MTATPLTDEERAQLFGSIKQPKSPLAVPLSPEEQSQLLGAPRPPDQSITGPLSPDEAELWRRGGPPERVLPPEEPLWVQRARREMRDAQAPVVDPTDLSEGLGRRMTKHDLWRAAGGAFGDAAGVLGWVFNRVDNLLAAYGNPLAQFGGDAMRAGVDHLFEKDLHVKRRLAEQQGLDHFYFDGQRVPLDANISPFPTNRNGQPDDSIAAWLGPTPWKGMREQFVQDIIEGGKALIGRQDAKPSDLFTVAEKYQERLNVQDQAAATAMGLGLAFLTTPASVAAPLKMGRKAAQILGITDKLEAMHPMIWRYYKLHRRAHTYTRHEQAQALAKGMSKPAKPLAREFTEQAGTQIGPGAVKQRLGSVLKGPATDYTPRDIQRATETANKTVRDKVAAVNTRLAKGDSLEDAAKAQGLTPQAYREMEARVFNPFTPEEIAAGLTRTPTGSEAMGIAPGLAPTHQRLQDIANPIVREWKMYEDALTELGRLGKLHTHKLTRAEKARIREEERKIYNRIRSIKGIQKGTETQKFIDVDTGFMFEAQPEMYGLERMNLKGYNAETFADMTAESIKTLAGLEDLAARYGFRLQLVPKHEVLGAYRFVPPKTILVNTSRTPQEQVWTTAHELFHAMQGEYGLRQGILGGQGPFRTIAQRMEAAALKEKDGIYRAIAQVDPRMSRVADQFGSLDAKMQRYYNMQSEILAHATSVYRDNPQVLFEAAPKTFKAMQQAYDYMKEFEAALLAGKGQTERVAELIGKKLVKGKAGFYRTPTKDKDGKLAWKVFYGSPAHPLHALMEQPQSRFAGQAKLLREQKAKLKELYKDLRMDDLEGGTSYTPRMYRSKQEAADAEARRKHAWGVSTGYTKERMNIPEHLRHAMGEMRDPVYPTLARMIQEGHDVELLRMYERTARTPTLAQRVPVGGDGPAGWKRMEANKARFGDLASMENKYDTFVHPKVYKDIMEIYPYGDGIGRAFDTWLGLWKTAKVVYSPSTHVRNFTGNIILNDLGGMPPAEQAKYITRAIHEMASGSKDWLAAKPYFKATTQLGGEIQQELLNAYRGSEKLNPIEYLFYHGAQAAKRANKYGPGFMYEHEDLVHKYARYMWNKDRGMSHTDSILDANKWLIDYMDISTAEKRYMRRLAPFYTFHRKALPLVLESMRDNPYALAKYLFAAQAMTKYSLAKLDLTEKDYEKIRAIAPDFMDGGILMPWRNHNGDLEMIDWTYFVPWGSIGEARGTGVLRQFVNLPLLQVVEDITRNRSSFTDSRITTNADSPAVARAKQVLYAWQNLAPLPPLFPDFISHPDYNAGGVYWDKLYDALTGTPSITISGEKQPHLGRAILHTVGGVRLQALDEKGGDYSRHIEISQVARDIENAIRETEMWFREGRLTQSQRDKRIESLKKQLTRRIGEIAPDKRR